MKKCFFLLFILIIHHHNVFSQTKTLTKSNKKNLVHKSADSLTKVKGKGKTIELAKENSLWFLNNEVINQLKDSLLSVSILENSDRELFLIKKRFENKNLIDSLLFLKNTFDYYSKENITSTYWEQLKNKKRKNIYFDFYISYYFSEGDLNVLKNEYVFVSTSLNKIYHRVTNLNLKETSIRNLIAYQDTIAKVSSLFLNENKLKSLSNVKSSIHDYLLNLSINVSQHEKGIFMYDVYNRTSDSVLPFKKSAKIISNCVQISNVLTSSKSNTVYYNNHLCKMDRQLIKIIIPLTEDIELTKVVDVNPKKSTSKIKLLSDLQIVRTKKSYKGIIKIQLDSETNVELLKTVSIDIYGTKIKGEIINPSVLKSNNMYIIEFDLPKYSYKETEYIWQLTFYSKDRLSNLEQSYEFYKVNYFLD